MYILQIWSENIFLMNSVKHIVTEIQFCFVTIHRYTYLLLKAVLLFIFFFELQNVALFWPFILGHYFSSEIAAF